MNKNVISPLDGRYAKKTIPLLKYFSEGALAQYRIKVEIQYLIALSKLNIGIRKFSKKEIEFLEAIYNLSEKDLKIISDIELKGYGKIKATDHDVKAIEYFIKEKIKSSSLSKLVEWIHFALTSEDTNNIAYSLMQRDSLEDVIIPKINEIIKKFEYLAKKYKNLSMLARTHGQPASPTTFGKEMKVFANRLKKQIQVLSSVQIYAKLNGATGNWNAHFISFPKINWIVFSKNFINSFNKRNKVLLKPNCITTQIENHDSYIEIFDSLKRLNSILIDFDQDIWRYISDEWIGQQVKKGSVGSSTMPHKINPIKFENSEGNLGIANSFFEFFARKLPISRLQRDLSDSTVLRNVGVAFAHSYIGYEYLLDGLSRIEVNKEKIEETLLNHPEVIAEAIQTILRKEGHKIPYELLKELTQGKRITQNDFDVFIDKLEIRSDLKVELKKITPHSYKGLSEKIVYEEI